MNWHPKRPDIRTEQMQSLRASGLSYKAIGKRLGLTGAGVHQRLKKAVEPAKQAATWQEIAKRRMLASAKKRARTEHVPFDLSLDDISIPAYCPALGIPLSLGAGRLTDYSPTLDKAIPSVGYTKRNVWVISWRANRAKSNLTLDELLRLSNAVRRKIQEELCP